MKDIVSDFFGEPVPPPLPSEPGYTDENAYQDALLELERFCDAEPKTLKHEPDYKPMPGAGNRFHRVIDVTYSKERRALVFTVFRPANPHSKSPKSEIRGLAIPDFVLAELGLGIPGEWKWKNEALNSGVEAADDLPDPFEDTDPPIYVEDIFAGGDPFAD